MAVLARLLCNKFYPILRSQITIISLSTSKAVQSFTYSKRMSTDGLTESISFSNADSLVFNPVRMTSQNLGAGSGPEGKILQPPPRKGMQVLDKAAFTKKVKIPTVLISDHLLHQKMKELRPYLLKVIKMKPVSTVECESNLDTNLNLSTPKKKVFLNPEVLKDVKTEELSHFISENLKMDSEVAESAYFEDVEFTYENWSWNQITDAILPDDLDKVSGFSHIGHIIHLNLRDHLLPFKNVIAQVLLDKIQQSRTVVNKLNIIENTYRNFQMEVLAGEPQTVVTVKQHHCEFEFDFAKVYWNPRLCTEHERIYKMLQAGDILYDVFAGVGPFSVPVGKKKCFVLANDLNPDSFIWLQNNVKKNKVHSQVQCFNKDGRDFIQQDIASHLTKQIDNPDSFDFSKQNFHVTMNLPAIAVEFLDSFWNLIPVNKLKMSIPTNLSFIVHVYCFIKDIDGYKEKALRLVETNLNYDLPKENVIDIQFVRNVAPNKEMLRVSFKVPHEILSSKSDQCNSVKRKFSEVE